MQLLCIIVSDEADIAAFKDYKPSAEDEAAPAPAAAPPSPAAAPPPSPAAALPPAAAPASAAMPSSPLTAPVSGGIIFASPYAKKIAAERNIDLAVSVLNVSLRSFRWLSKGGE